MSFYPFISPLCLASILLGVAPQAALGNRLRLEQSPYLLQHADNPVEWFPWSEEAFALAEKERRLIFLSIGYSTCHWCHVMEHESFEDTEVAKLLNKDFVAIKVDREERPDIDQFYMQVATRLTGQGGWPLTIIMTPDKVPLFAATYLPKTGRYNRPGMVDLLPQIAAAWTDHPQQLEHDARQFLVSMAPQSAAQAFDPVLIEQAVGQMRSEFDAKDGGFGAAPKFPRPHQLSFLLQRYRIDRNPQLLAMVETTLSAMRDGGIYDQLGYGFHRYSTDKKWLVPHFEKMLYDQAGVAEVYLEAFQVTGKPDYAATAREIFSYLQDQMRNPQGGFYSAEDADTEKAEGSTYLWTEKELLEVLGPERGARFVQYFGVTTPGNFPDETTGAVSGNNILHRTRPIAVWAKEFDMSAADLSTELDADRTELMRLREHRPQPFRDDKVLTAWNGMVISAFSKGGTILRSDELLKIANETADFVLTKLRKADGHLLRRWRNGQAAINAFAEDYAYLARGLLDLYHADLDPRRLQQALALADILFDEFAGNGTIYTSADLKELPQRTSERYDGAIPSTPSIALEVAARLAQLTGDVKWSERAARLLEGATSEVKRYPQGFPHLLSAAERLLGKSRELVIIGQRADPHTREMLEILRKADPTLTSLLFVEAEEPDPLTVLAPFTRDMHQINGLTTAYLCENHACGRPVTDPAQFSQQLGR
ncbi:thioredoxin domain-containing protein [Geopsychrobacter electrodiphilus]|uniref:thioredoxin domain-containing protein n=1 Tax=Geopsychrobacter electrodiphilus TaxID=225196 RepID=UPI0003625C93|nr:thioredoxin domain-containing protein [Geopsychrobacter electrodiphilus]